MNNSTKNEQPNFKNGYGKFPYVIERLSSGTYRQIPIVFNVAESNQDLVG